MLSKFILFTLAFTLSLGITNQAAQAQVMPSDTLDLLQPQSRQAWQKHLEWSASIPVQEGCDPYYLAPKLKAGEQAKGAVVLVHGFTACAQQNDGIAPLLAKDGYHVFVPRVPGHGLPASRTSEGWRDDLSTMVYKGHAQDYVKFAASMNDFVRHEPGLKGIAGVSLGGALAASSVVQAPHLYNRSLIMTPLYDVIAPRNSLLPFLSTILPDYRIHWGPICDKERLMGRGGYCEFAVANIAALQNFGMQTLEQSHQMTARTQFVGVEGDTAASNPRMLKAHHNTPYSQACLYELGSSHSMLSPYDNQHEDKFWVPRLHQQIRRFINTGEYFDTQGPSIEAGFQQCVSR